MNLNELQTAKHILIVTDNNSFANASAIYTYLLTLHKKVSIYKSEVISTKLSFLPWFDKLRDSKPSSAELIIEASSDVISLVDYFKKHEIKINKKMATSLYSAVLMRYDNFLDEKCDGIVFAVTSELIESGADFKLANENIRKSFSLSSLRLRAIMLQKMLVVDDAKKVELYINEADLQATGATIGDALFVMKEAITLVNVKEVILIKDDENNKILKSIKEI